jgi:hypothetical protein
MHTPKKFNTYIFGQIDPGKTRKGKTSERGDFYYFELGEIFLLQQNYTQH